VIQDYQPPAPFAGFFVFEHYSGTSIPIMDTSPPFDSSGSSPQKPLSPVALLWRLMQGFRALYAWAVGALFLHIGINYLTPLVATGTIDYVLSGEPMEESLPARILGLLGGPERVGEALWLPGLVMLLLTVVAGGFHYLKGRWAAQASDGLARRLKDRLYDHLQHLPSRYHDRADTGDIIQRCTSDVETLRMAMSSQVLAVSQALLLLLTALPLMILLDLRMTVVSLILVGPIMVYGFFYFGKVKHLFRQVAEAEGKVTDVVQENLTGLRVVRAFARQDFEIEKFAGPNRLYRDRSLHLLRLMAWYWSTSDLVAIAQQGLVLFAGVYFISQGTLTVGTLFAFIVYLNLLLWPVRQMGRTLTELGKSIVALSRIGEILAVREEPAPASPAQPAHRRSAGKIEVTDLVFSHAEGAAALDGISFTVEPGQTLAILGPSGAGKSTLMHLLLRLYDYSAGSIRLDGYELRDLDRHWVRSQFSVVMQEPFLYSKSISENIRIGRVDTPTPDSDIAEAARMANIHDTITSFPDGYSTLVGERGITLSGGQRQRVALARALLRDAPVLLLDDALSAVDAETESTILEALQRRHGKRTTLVIAHRLSTLAQADQVIVLEAGRIIQRGTHEELARRDGLYRRLWEIQNKIEADLRDGLAAATPTHPAR
jgi:ATP-binding cassette, subfamily B, bacterial